MRYLTVQESLRRLRAAGVSARRDTLREWIREERLRDVWVMGPHTYIYEGEIESLIAAGNR
jgi:hypothetical protein